MLDQERQIGGVYERSFSRIVAYLPLTVMDRSLSALLSNQSLLFSGEFCLPFHLNKALYIYNDQTTASRRNLRELAPSSEFQTLANYVDSRPQFS